MNGKINKNDFVSRYIFEKGDLWVLEQKSVSTNYIDPNYFFGKGTKPTNIDIFLEDRKNVVKEFGYENRYDQNGEIEQAGFLVIVDGDFFNAHFVLYTPRFVEFFSSEGYTEIEGRKAAFHSKDGKHYNLSPDGSIKPSFRDIETVKQMLLTLILSNNPELKGKDITLYGDFPAGEAKLSNKDYIDGFIAIRSIITTKGFSIFSIFRIGQLLNTIKDIYLIADAMQVEHTPNKEICIEKLKAIDSNGENLEIINRLIAKLEDI